MKKFLISAIVVIALIGCLGAGYAYYSDTETSNGNTFTAGTLNIVCAITGSANGVVTDGPDGSNDNVTFSNLKPGDSGFITWTVTNTGNLNGHIMIARTITNDSDGVNTEPELLEDSDPTEGELDDNMLLISDIMIDGVPTAATWNSDFGVEGTWPNTQFDHLPKVLPAGKVMVVKYQWFIPTTVTNIIQGDTFTLNMVFNLDQIENPAVTPNPDLP